MAPVVPLFGTQH